MKPNAVTMRVLGMIESPKQARDIAAQSDIKEDTARRALNRLYDSGFAERRRVRAYPPAYYYVKKENADLLDAACRPKPKPVQAPVPEVKPGFPDLSGRLCAMGVWI